jgi:hypothetical protein
VELAIGSSRYGKDAMNEREKEEEGELSAQNEGELGAQNEKKGSRQG